MFEIDEVVTGVALEEVTPLQSQLAARHKVQMGRKSHRKVTLRKV